jgi:hypothetical protein
MGRRQPPLDRGAQMEMRYEVPTPRQRILYTNCWQRTCQPPEPKTFRENRVALASRWIVDTKLGLYSRGRRRKTASPKSSEGNNFLLDGHLGTYARRECVFHDLVRAPRLYPDPSSGSRHIQLRCFEADCSLRMHRPAFKT